MTRMHALRDHSCHASETRIVIWQKQKQNRFEGPIPLPTTEMAYGMGLARDTSRENPNRIPSHWPKALGSGEDSHHGQWRISYLLKIRAPV